MKYVITFRGGDKMGQQDWTQRLMALVERIRKTAPEVYCTVWTRVGSQEMTKDQWLQLDKDLLHREDGPAVKAVRGSEAWFLNGKKHRENGPAVKYSDGRKEWWLDGRCYSEQQYWERFNQCCSFQGHPLYCKCEIDQ